MSNFSCFDGAKILITGHTGFKGSWLSLWLTKLGAQVYGVSQDIPTTPSLFTSIELDKKLKDYRFDICEKDLLNNLIGEIKPNFIFHLAAQSLVRPSYKDPLNTLKTNALGTAKVLESLRLLDIPIVAVMITSDKVYDNVEWPWGYREIDRIGGKDPYSASKGMAELVIRTYNESFFKNQNSQVKIGIARAGNVIGGGDWAEDRIVPDCVRAWSKGKIVSIRNPKSTRPWQHVLEPLSGYLTLAAYLNKNPKKNCEAYNFGPLVHQTFSVEKLIDEMSKLWGDQLRWENFSTFGLGIHEAGLLKLNCDKALQDLNWIPTLDFEETIRMTAKWYKTFYNDISSSMSEFTLNQISEYTELAYSRTKLVKNE